MLKIPTITIVGRINTGKSTLFNRLTESRKAIVSPVAGTTRDYNLGKIIWKGRQLNIIDTGGVDIETLARSIAALAEKKPYPAKDSIEKNIIRQTHTALSRADLVLMLVDGKAGLLPTDKTLAMILKKISKKERPIILAVNKIDKQKFRSNISEFYKLGLGEPVPISALNGSGTGDLLDEIYKKLKLKKIKSLIKKEADITRVAILGKPNVGKSSLMNRLSGTERAIVSEITQTTREPQYEIIKYKEHNLMFIDTAGLQRKKPRNFIDKVASRMGLSVLKRAAVVLFLVESQQPLSTQDTRIAGMIKEAGAKTIIIANKWDLIENKKPGLEKKFIDYIYHYLPPLRKSPIIFTSALTGKNVNKILEMIVKLLNC